MSYVSQQFLLYDASSLANFKNWAQAFSTALSSSGWVQTSDTGQVNWGTIVSVPASGSFVYEVWKPADALQTGATQFFMLVEYGKSNNATPGPRLRITLGAGTNGSGALTGLTTVTFDGFGPDDGGFAGQGSILTYDCYFSGDVDRFGFMLYRSGAFAGSFQSFMMGIERTKNTDGTNSSDGVQICLVNRNNRTRGQQTLVFGIGVASLGNTAPDNANYAVVGWDNQNSSGAFNNNIPVFPVAPVYGKVGNPMTTVAFVHSQDVAEGCIFTTTLYGATRTYIASGAFTSISGPTNLSSARVCMRYD